MTHPNAPDPGITTRSHPRLSRIARFLGLAVRALQVRLRFVAILVAACALAGQWDTLQTYWDHWTRDLGRGGAPSRAAPPNSEYFCPMDPVVVAMRPGKCDICNMALVRRQVGDSAPLPSGVLARMQFSPYRVLLAGLQTAPVDYRATMLEVTLDGVVRDDGRIACRVPETNRSLVAVGLAADITTNDGSRRPSLEGTVAELSVDAGDHRASAVVRLPGSGPAPQPGTRVVVTIRRPVAELDPFRSLPVNPPPRAPGDPLAVYVCPQHPEVVATDRGRCPIDRENNLQRQALLDSQRVGWWCPMHPAVAADHAGESCSACGGMTLIPRVVSYRPTGQVLTVPESAVVDTGLRTVVFVERMPGMFDGVEVVVGPRCGDAYPVASGLDQGQRVAVRGAFLLDAETRLNPSIAASYFGAGRPTRGRATDRATDKPPTAEPGVCPVTGRALGSMGPPVTVAVAGRTVQLCCQGCEGRLRQSPERYLSQAASRPIE